MKAYYIMIKTETSCEIRGKMFANRRRAEIEARAAFDEILNKLAEGKENKADWVDANRRELVDGHIGIHTEDGQAFDVSIEEISLDETL